MPFRLLGNLSAVGSQMKRVSHFLIFISKSCCVRHIQFVTHHDNTGLIIRLHGTDKLQVGLLIFAVVGCGLFFEQM